MTDADARLTVLTTRGIAAVKTFTRRGTDRSVHVEGYGRAKRFTAHEVTVDEKGRWLRKLGQACESFVVLGRPVDWKDGEIKRRLSTERDGDDPTLEDVPRIWMPIDIDQLDFKPMADLSDGEMLCLEVLDRLKINGTQCIWHLTNSHAIEDRYRIRVWLRLSEAKTAAQMRAWAMMRWGEEKVDVDGKMKRIVDMSVLRPAQPIYTGDPVFVGMDDPVGTRVGAIDGEMLELKVPKSQASKGKAPEDENIEVLEESGLYIKRLRPGQHSIVCPWEESHTGEERDDDTFYFEPHHNGHDIPNFKCHHDGCAEKGWSDVLAHLGVKGSSSFSPVGGDSEERWVYIHRLEQFWDPRDGIMVTPKAYDSMHGLKSKKGTPTERFIIDPKTQKVDAVEFLPGQPRVTARNRVKILNTYIDCRLTPDPSADASKFVDHMEWLVPNGEDRDHLMDWLAWAYQHPGDKITWAPILYGCPGTGKTTVFNALAYCLGTGHMSEPTQAELEDKFNDWCHGKLLVKIEELMSGDKFHVAEKLKPVVANATISIRAMHRTGFSVKNVANVCASTNHMQALPIEKGDRRYMLIECVDSPKEEREPRMKGLHRWLDKVGYGGIAAWLSDRDVTQFRPRSEAPETRLKNVVIEASRSDLERATDLCEAFDDEEVVTSAIVQEYLANNECVMPMKRLGLIAAKRKWKMLPARQGRVRAAGKRLTIWSPAGSVRAMMKVANMEPQARDRWLGNLAGKLIFSSGTDGEK